jgi:hypothetical protein
VGVAPSRASASVCKKRLFPERNLIRGVAFLRPLDIVHNSRPRITALHHAIDVTDIAGALNDWLRVFVGNSRNFEPLLTGGIVSRIEFQKAVEDF